MGSVDANKAFDIRQRLKGKRKGKVTTSEKRWLLEYQERTGSTLTPRGLLTAGTPGEPSSPAPPFSLPEAPEAPEEKEEKEPEAPTELPPLELPGLDLDPPPAREAPPPSSPRSSPSSPPAPPPGPTPEQKEQASFLAKLFIDTVHASNRELKKEFPDAWVLPPVVIDKFIAPAAERLAAKYVPELDMANDLVDALAVGVGALSSMGQLYMRREQKKKPKFGGANVSQAEPEAERGRKVIEVEPSAPTNGPTRHADTGFTDAGPGPLGGAGGGESFAAPMRAPWPQ
jgi:hypothetical protein